LPVNLRPSPWELAGSAKRSETWRMQYMYEQIACCVGASNVESIQMTDGQVKTLVCNRTLKIAESNRNIQRMMAIVDEGAEAEVRHNLESMGYQPVSSRDSHRGVVMIFNQQSKV